MTAMVRSIDNNKKYFCKDLRISNWSYAKIIFQSVLSAWWFLMQILLFGENELDHPPKYVCKYIKNCKKICKFIFFGIR